MTAEKSEIRPSRPTQVNTAVALSLLAAAFGPLGFGGALLISGVPNLGADGLSGGFAPIIVFFGLIGVVYAALTAWAAIAAGRGSSGGRVSTTIALGVLVLPMLFLAYWCVANVISMAENGDLPYAGWLPILGIASAVLSLVCIVGALFMLWGNAAVRSFFARR